MKNPFKQITKNINKNGWLWKKRASIVYALGAWTVLGVALLFAGNPRNLLQRATQPLMGVGNEEGKEQEEMLRKKQQEERSQANAEYVAEHNFTQSLSQFMS